MRFGFSDVVEHFLSGGRLAGLLGPGSGVESGGLSLQGEADLCTELAEGSLGLAILGQREPPLLTHLLNSTDRVLLTPAVRHFHRVRVTSEVMLFIKPWQRTDFSGIS